MHDHELLETDDNITESHHRAVEVSGSTDGEETEKRKVYGKTHSHILDLLTREIGTYRILDKMEFINLSREVEDLYSQAIDILASSTEYLEEALARYTSIVLSGTTRGRVMHNVPCGNKDPQWKRNHEFLVNGLQTLADCVWGRKKPKDRKKFAISFKKLKVVGSLLYNALEEFCSIGAEYKECSWRLSLMLLAGNTSQEEIAEVRKTIADLVKDLHTPESEVVYVVGAISKIFMKIQQIHKFIFLHHSRLLIKVAASLTTEPDQLLDNFQAGGFGLIRAIRDHNPPYNFVGYASSWIRQSVLGNMRSVSNCIRVPSNILQEYSSLERVRQGLPTDQQDLDNLAKVSGQNPKKVKRIYDLVAIARTYSLDREVRNAHDPEAASISLQDTIPDENATPEKFTENTEVEKLFSLLSDKEQWVLANFYGLQDYLSRCQLNKCKESNLLEKIRQMYLTVILKRRRRSRVQN